MPMDIAVKYARLPHGMVYHYQQWIPEEAIALVVFVHGLGDHVGRYGLLTRTLTTAGCACAMFDQRGHGRSEGRRGHVDRFMDWVDDLASFVQFSAAALPPATPLYVVGHSLGALIGINYLLTHAAPVSGLVAMSPAFAPTVQIPQWKRRLGTRVARLMPELSIDNGVRIDALTREAVEVEALKHDPLFHRRITLGAGCEIVKNLELVGGLPHRIHVPVLVLGGSADQVCDPAAMVHFAKGLPHPESAYHLYQGMYHDLLHDVGREQVAADLTGWIARHAARQSSDERQYALNRREALWENVSHS